MREINEMLDTGRDAHETLLRAGARRSEATRESAEGFGGVVSEMRRRSESGTIPEEDEGGLSINGDASEDETSAEEDRIEEGIDGGEGDGAAGARGGTEEEEGDGEEAGGRPAAGGASGIVRQRRVPTERDEQDKPLPLPKPDNEPAYLFEQPFENPSASPAFAAPLNFPDIATKEKENLPSALTNYRRRFVDAARTARFLYDDIVAQASQLAIQVRQEDNRRASRRSNDLAQALLLHDRNLAKAQLQLSNNVAHDLAQHDANLKLAISKIYGAAANGKARMAALAAGFHGRLSAEHGIVGTIEGKISGAMGELTAAQTAATGGLRALSANPANYFSDNPVESVPMSGAINETLIGRVGSWVTDALDSVTTECSQLQTSLANQATTLQPQMIKAFCQFTNWETLLRIDAPRQVDTAASGAVTASRKMAKRVRKQILTNARNSQSALINQANRDRKQLIAAARGRSARERGAAQAQDKRARTMTNAIGAGPVQAVNSIYATLVKRSGGKESDIAQIAVGFADNFVRTGQPAIMSRKQQARKMALQGFAQLESDSTSGGLTIYRITDNSAAALDKSVVQAAAAGDQIVMGTRHELLKLSKPVSDAASGTIRSVERGFAGAKRSLNSSLSSTLTSVENSLSGTPPPAPETPTTPPVEVPCEGACCDASSPNSSTPPPPPPPPVNMSMPQPEGPRAAIARIKAYGDAPKTHPTIVEFISTATNHVRQTIQDKAEAMRRHLSVLDAEASSIMPHLRGLTPPRALALRDEYGSGNLEKLPDDLKFYLNAGNALSGVTTRVENIRAAINYVYGNAVAGAHHELNAAVEWSNENQRIIDVMQSLTPAQMAELNQRDLSNVRDDLGAQTGAIFDDLRRGDVDSGRGRQLIDQVNEARSSHDDSGVFNARDRVRESYQGSGGTALQGQNILGVETRREIEANRTRNWEGALTAIARITGPAGTPATVEAGRAALLNLAAGDRTYTVVVHHGGPEGGDYHTETRTDTVRESQRRATQLLILNGPDHPDTLAAEMAVELERPSQLNQDRVRRITRAVEVNPNVTRPGTPAYAEAVARRNAFLGRVNEYSPTLSNNPDGSPPTPEQLTEALGNRLAATAGTDTATGNYLRTLLIADPNNTANIVAQLNFAMDGAGTNMDALKHTLRGLTREQFDEVRRAYDAAHPGGPDLLTRIGIRGRGNIVDSDTSGGDAQDLEILSLGIPRTTRERAEIAAMQMRQQIRDAGTVGSWLAGDEFSRLQAGERNLMGMMGADHMGFNADGDLVAYAADNSEVRLGNFDINGEYIPGSGRSQSDLELAIAAGPGLAETYKAATDRIANAITTTLVVAAAIISTVLTGGAAASIWIPMLVTFGAGVAGMIVNRAIKGARYGHEEMFQDFAVTLVQTLTAGAGAAIGLYARGGSMAVRALGTRLAMSEKLLENFLTTQGTRMVAMGLGRQIAVGAATGAIGGVGNAMLDGEAWRKGTWGVGLLHGAARGALGGGVSAAAARPFARFMSSSSVSTRALARGISSGIGGAGSRGTEIFYDYGRGTYRGTLGQALGEMRDAGIQNAIQGVGEAYGEHVGDRGAMQGRGIAARFRRSDDRVIDIEAHYNPNIRRGPEAGVGEEGTVPVVPRITGEPSDVEPAVRRPAGPANDDPAPRPGRPDLGDADDVDPARSRRPLTDEETTDPARLPTDDSDVTLRPHPDIDEPPILRSILPDEPSLRAAGDPPGRVLTPANDNGPAPVVRVALTADTILSMRPVGENTVVIHPDATNLQAANDNYRMLIEADPTREVGIFRNPQTGEYIVVQGRTSAITVPKGDLTSAGTAPSRWITERHFHPNVPGQSASGMIVRMPSGVGGDFTQIIRDLIALGGSPRQSSVDYMHEGRLIQTDFGVDPSSTTGRFWIDYPDPVTGARTRQNFANMADYHAFVGQTLNRTYNFPTGMGEPSLRSVTGGSSEHPHALAPGSRATTLSDVDRNNILALATQADSIADMVPMMREAALGGASERVVAAMQDDLFAAISDMMPALRNMGLVEGNDSMARLHLIINELDIPITRRQAIIDAVMVANREAMIIGGTLQRNQAVVAMLHGAPGTRAASIRRDGIDLAKLGIGDGDDFSRGFYMTNDLAAAQLYRFNRSGGDPGEIFPFMMRMSDMANAIDVRPGGAHRAQWEDWLGRPAYPPLPMTNYELYAMNAHRRGQGFDNFLRATELASPHPGLVLGDLGGTLTSGVVVPNRITDQAAVSNQAIIDAFNEQLGSRRTPPQPVAEDNSSLLRSIVDPDETTTPKPLAAEGETTLARTSTADAGPTAAGADIPPPKGYSNWHDVPDSVRARFEAAALARFKSEWPSEGKRLDALIRHDEASAIRAMQAENETVRTQAIADFEAAMIAGGMNPNAARRNARLLTELANVSGPRFRHNLRHAVELDIWNSRLAAIPLELRPMARDSSLLLFLAANHPAVLATLHTRFLSETVIPPGGKRTTAMFEDFVARALKDHPEAIPGAEGRRILRFDDADLFNEAANVAAPLTRYEFGKLAYTTDALGRVAVAEGVPERVTGHRSSSSLQTKIGNEGAATDVGFHLIAHIFGAEINRLAVVPGNGKRISGDPDPNLNGSAYKVEFENIVRNILDDTDQIVEVEVGCSYNSGNHTSRPDFFHVRFRTDAGTWVTVTFPNKQ